MKLEALPPLAGQRLFPPTALTLFRQSMSDKPEDLDIFLKKFLGDDIQKRTEEYQARRLELLEIALGVKFTKQETSECQAFLSILDTYLPNMQKGDIPLLEILSRAINACLAVGEPVPAQIQDLVARNNKDTGH